MCVCVGKLLNCSEPFLPVTIATHGFIGALFTLPEIWFCFTVHANASHTIVPYTVTAVYRV